MPCNLTLDLCADHKIIVFPSNQEENKYFRQKRKQKKKKEKEDEKEKKEKTKCDDATPSTSAACQTLSYISSSSDESLTESLSSSSSESPERKRSKKNFSGYAILAHTEPFLTGVLIKSKFRINNRAQWMSIVTEAQRFLRTQAPRDFFQASPQNGYEVCIQKIPKSQNSKKYQNMMSLFYFLPFFCISRY